MINAKMKYMIPVLAVVFLAVAIGCASRAQTGAGVGAVSGGIIGGLGGHWIIGAGLGAALGYIVGNEWDKHDESQAENSFKSGRKSSWRNSETGRSYTSQPSEPYYRNGREYKNVTITDDRGRSRNATLAKSQDGRWEVVE